MKNVVVTWQQPAAALLCETIAGATAIGRLCHWHPRRGTSVHCTPVAHGTGTGNGVVAAAPTQPARPGAAAAAAAAAAGGAGAARQAEPAAPPAAAPAAAQPPPRRAAIVA
jgi:hypothetical protein